MVDDNFKSGIKERVKSMMKNHGVEIEDEHISVNVISTNDGCRVVVDVSNSLEERLSKV
jgi:galactitol-specific phosphotransferase system IIB component